MNQILAQSTVSLAPAATSEPTEPTFSLQLIDSLTDTGFTALRDYLENNQAPAAALALVDALALFANEGFYRARAGGPTWVNDEFLAGAIGDLSRAVPALGGTFHSPSGELIK